MTARIANPDAARYIGVSAFASHTGALSGRPVDFAAGYHYDGTGVLPAEWRELYRASRIDFVVWSYVTPIAWRLADGTWIVPAVRYSVTTSKHQGIVRRTVGDWTDIDTARAAIARQPLRQAIDAA